MKKKYSIYASWYFFMFFALGTFLPLFSQYLKWKDFSGTQLGLAFSLGSLATIIMQPIWGYISDHYKKPKLVINLLIIAASIATIGIALSPNVLTITIFYLVFMVFFSGLNPVCDSLVLASPFPFGKIRLWGAVGFAIGVQIAGILAEKFGLNIIFPLIIISYIITLAIVRLIEVEEVEEHPISKKDIITLLTNKKFIVFLLGSFMIGGTITAHNNYFGILYRELGGSIAGIGLAFLLFAGSEAPVMVLSQNLAKKINLSLALFISSLIFNLRWFWYGTGPNPNLILVLFFLQGLSIGSYLVFVTLFIGENTKSNLRTTAIAIYASFSVGVGGMIMQYISGLLLESRGIEFVYSFYFYCTIVASLLYFLLYMMDKKNSHK